MIVINVTTFIAYAGGLTPKTKVERLEHNTLM